MRIIYIPHKLYKSRYVHVFVLFQPVSQHPAHHHHQHHHRQQQQTSAYGIDNPAYDYDGGAAATDTTHTTYPSLPPPASHNAPVPPTHNAPLVVSKRRKMDRATAAAIAVRQDHNSSPFMSDTTQLISSPDNVVVYDERTAL